MSSQREEILAWLGPDHGLTNDQLDQLIDTANDLDARYPDPDEAEEKEAALTVAYRLMIEDHNTVINEVVHDHTRAQQAALRAKAGLQQIARTLLTPGQQGQHRHNSETALSQRLRINRATIRKWTHN